MTLTNPYTEIINGNCLDVMRSRIGDWQRAFDFVFADPPFNIGHGYDVYNDSLPPDAFFEFTSQWVGYLPLILKPGGIAAINIPDSMVRDVLNIAAACSLTRIDWVIWHYRFGQCVQSKFISSHAHCLIFRNDSVPCAPGEYWPHTFNADAVMVPSDRSTVYSDSRTLDSATPGYRVPLDVWCMENDGQHWGRVNGNSAERIAGHPNQLPEKYLERLIKAYTNSGEWVLDPFGGTGTTAVVARELQRNCITIELSAAYATDIAQRCASGAVRVVSV